MRLEISLKPRSLSEQENPTQDEQRLMELLRLSWDELREIITIAATDKRDRIVRDLESKILRLRNLIPLK